ncbi:putative alcohol dehydrogenase [Thozetella sp. PMI_491]|nr:putative alcohol dehydrogenase [Thozetella sp. PMI_491]
MDLPLTQTAIWVDSSSPLANPSLKHDVPVPKPRANEVLVHIEYSGICHSDVYNMMGSHPMEVNVAGHEGIGHIVQVGELVQQDGSLSLGQRVGVKWIHETCGTCEVCQRDETLCPSQHNCGRDRPGTLQQYVAVSSKHATPIPPGIGSEIAAPLLCAGLTMYSAIKKTKANEGDWMVIQGAGGGLGHIGIQIAARRGLKVIAIDQEEKRNFCMSLGAEKFFSFDDTQLEGSLIAATGSLGAHGVICCVGAEAAYNQAVKLLRRGGSLICVGLPANVGYQIPLGPIEMVVRGLQVFGSSVGTEGEMQELLQLVLKGGIKPVVDVVPLSDFQNAIELVKSSKAKGRVVLKMSL